MITNKPRDNYLVGEIQIKKSFFDIYLPLIVLGTKL